ncbi:MAG: 23S rRNA (adenine(2503)-C(2))-methyltransferase RlmN [Lachnospiraceae bacterium]|nr:23S rRNA (adenine(2503)-C(2))-methyltransferase RlmN [Lachnospiraceae bacterium]
MKPDILSLSLEEIRSLVSELGQPKFRADQLYRWLHISKVASFKEMTNLPSKMIAQLEERYIVDPIRLVTYQESAVDGTRKYLFALPDGNLIESVRMIYHHGISVCISTQVGCRMGCVFCASTLDGLLRNLTVGEMLGQVYAIIRHTGERVSNLVLMGCGEPMDNYDNVVAFVRRISDENGEHISQRNITVSTCGLVPKILKLKDENLQITLAISLHAADDEKRKALMPVARVYSIAELLTACRDYYDENKRRLTFEYGLVRGENDSQAYAEKLGKLLNQYFDHAHVNLIPINPVKERNYNATETQAVYAFQKKLEKFQINATIRREMGRDIDGACGQLRRRYSEGKPESETLEK